MTAERNDFIRAMRSVANSVAVVPRAAGALMADKYPD